MRFCMLPESMALERNLFETRQVVYEYNHP